MPVRDLNVKVQPLDLSKLYVYPVMDRESLTCVDDIVIDPQSIPRSCSQEVMETVIQCAEQIRHARSCDAGVILMYGAHLLRNGAARILDEMMKRGWLTHLATNGAATIHDWEYAWLGASTESVQQGVATGRFGTWHETANSIHLALMAGALDSLGYGRALGRFISEDGATLPDAEELIRAITRDLTHPLSSARLDLLRTMQEQNWTAGRTVLHHRWKQASILASAWKHGVPLTVHPGIGYDIISNHPVFHGAAIGRAAEWDFKLFAGSVDRLDHGVVLSIGSAVMGPQVFEKSLSCVNNLRLHSGRDIVRNHAIHVVDLQDGGGWDWKQGEPPKTNPAYYLRFCKSFSRMGGSMNYTCCDNVTFLHHLYHELCK